MSSKPRAEAQSTPKPPWRVFLSYAGSERSGNADADDASAAFAKLLQKDPGAVVEVIRYQDEALDNWISWAEAEIPRVHLLVAFITHSYVDSDACQRELTIALDLQKQTGAPLCTGLVFCSGAKDDASDDDKLRAWVRARLPEGQVTDRITGNYDDKALRAPARRCRELLKLHFEDRSLPAHRPPCTGTSPPTPPTLTAMHDLPITLAWAPDGATVTLTFRLSHHPPLKTAQAFRYCRRMFRGQNGLSWTFTRDAYLTNVAPMLKELEAKCGLAPSQPPDSPR